MIFHFNPELPRTTRVQIRLDGERISSVVFADEERGLVYVTQKEPAEFAGRQIQRTVRDLETGDYAFTALTGKVQIEWPEDAETRPLLELNDLESNDVVEALDPTPPPHSTPPPLGLEPRKFWLEARAGKLAAAIQRYTEFSGKQAKEFRLIERWSAELRELLAEIEMERL